MGVWRLVLSPVLAATWVTLGLAVLLLLRVGSAVRSANDLHHQCHEMRSALIAADLARTLVERGGDEGVLRPGPWLHEPTATLCDVQVAEGDRIEIAVGRGDAAVRYSGRLLAGAAPEAFSYRAVVGDSTSNDALPAAAVLSQESLPRVHWAADRVEHPQSIVCDVHGLAPRLLERGTDARDFVLKSGTSQGAAPDGVIQVDGHLWIPPGQPVRLWLDRDITIAAKGNLYIGANLVVDGPGRLLLVALADRGLVFHDASGDGYHGADEPVHQPAEFGFGGIEGQGAVHCGLPGADPASELTLDASLLAYGEVRAACITRVAGPVIAHGGSTGPAVATGGGAWVLDVATDGLPGVATQGAPRPSALRRLR